MSDDNKVSWVLDLDVKEFTESGLKAKGIIESIGKAENLTGLLEGLKGVGLMLGAVGVAAFAFKEALDLTIEGEQLEKLNRQFNLLAESAGISAEELRKGMEKSANGLLTTAEMLKEANKGLVEMGSNAVKIPQLMELARKVTAVFGGTFLDTYQQMSQAMAMGNVRALKHYGIIIDTNKAIADFARANGLAQNELSEAAKKQAIMNEALEVGQQKFKNINSDQKSSLTIIQQTKVAWGELAEAFAVAFNKVFGPTVKNLLGLMKDFATASKNYMLQAFGSDDQKLEASISLLENKIKGLKESMSSFAKAGIPADSFTKASIDSIKRMEAELDVLRAKRKTDEKEEVTVSAARTKMELANLEEHKKNQLHYSEEILKIRAAELKSEEKLVQSEAQIEAAIHAHSVALANENAIAIRKIASDTALSQPQKDKLVAMEHDKFEKQKRAADAETFKLRQQLNDQYVKNSTTAFQGIDRAAHKMAMDARHDLGDMGRFGTAVMQSFQANTQTAFEAIGQGMVNQVGIGKSVANALKGAFLGMIGDRAQAEGALLLTEGIATLNPLYITGGGALVALGAALHSLAGSSTSIASGTSGGGTGSSQSNFQNNAPSSQPAAAAASGPTTPDTQASTTAQQQIKRSVVINIAGNLMNTSESQRSIMELMRKETDATDFTYTKIGV